MTSYLLKIRGGAEVDSSGKKAGKGALVFEEKSGTLGTSQDQYLFQGKEPIYSIEGNMTRPTHKGSGVTDTGVMYTLNTVEQHAVCYGITSSDGMSGNNQPVIVGLVNSVGGQSEQATEGDISPTLKATHYKTPPVIAFEPGILKREGGHYHEDGSVTLRANMGDNQVAVAIDCRNHSVGEVSGTLQAKPNGGQSLNFINPVGIPAETGEYVVRRLTPTECCRLQGFPDGWGEIDHKEDFTDEEYKEWLEIRKTHAEIMGTQTKEWSKEQMLKWYNGLHTDSAEYKMWGNGIALPCALYVFEGLAEELRNNE